MRSMQTVAHCAKKLRHAGHLKPKYTLPEIGKSFGDRGQPRIPQELAAGPRDIGMAKAAAAQELCPELRLLMLKPFNVGRERVPNSQVAEKIMSRCIHDDELGSRPHQDRKSVV